MSVRLRKAVRDLWVQRGRAALVVVAMVLGVASVVAVTTSSAVLNREIAAEFRASAPHTALITAKALTPDDVAAARDVPGVAVAEARTTVTARVLVDGTWVSARLFARPDLAASRLGRLVGESGTWPPAAGTAAIERAATSVAGAGVGDVVRVALPGRDSVPVPVSAEVHDIGQAPAWQENLVYLYLQPADIVAMGGPDAPNELALVGTGPRSDRAATAAVAERVAETLRERGVAVTGVAVPEPDRHPHQGQMNSLLRLLAAFGLLVLLLSGVLVAAQMSAVLARERRHVGTLRTLGASTGQVVRLYGQQVLLLAAVALAIGWPLGWLVGRGYTGVVGFFLNFDVVDQSVPPGVVAAQVAGSLLVPLAAAAWPILSAARLPPATVIRDYGVAEPVRRRRAGRWDARLPQVLRMGLRNVFRRRRRLALTLVALVAGGALFQAGLNLVTGLNRTLDGKSAVLAYDVAVALDRPYDTELVESVARAVPGVQRSEGWLTGRLAVGRGADLARDPSYAYGVPPETDLLRLPVVDGRWLREDDTTAVVVNHVLAASRPELTVGSRLDGRVDGHSVSWEVVGVVRQVASEPAVYVSAATLADVLEAGGATNALRVTAARGSDLSAVRRSLDDALADADIAVVHAQSTPESQQVLREHSVVILSLLLLMTVLSIAVGALGLATTMAVNVMERTREIGVLRAYGARRRAVIGLVVAEAGGIAALSWLLAVAASFPVTVVFGDLLGSNLLETPLVLAPNPWAVPVWLAVVVACCALATVPPARRAAGLTVRDTLAYS